MNGALLLEPLATGCLETSLEGGGWKTENFGGCWGAGGCTTEVLGIMDWRGVGCAAGVTLCQAHTTKSLAKIHSLVPIVFEAIISTCERIILALMGFPNLSYIQLCE